MIWYASKTSGKFREGQYYRTEQLGVLGRMARKAGYLVPAPPQLEFLTHDKPAQKVRKPRKKAPPAPAKGTADSDGQAPV
jgi:hypothetical protein